MTSPAAKLGRRSLLTGAAAAASLGAGSQPRYHDQAAPSVSLAELGSQSGTENAGPLLQAALARLPRRGGAVLHIPAGIWRFTQTEGTALNISDFEDLVVDGYGAQLLFCGRTHPFIFSDCRAPVLRGVTIDWPRPPFSQGEVVSADASGRLADVRIDPGFPMDGSEPIRAIATYDRRLGLLAHGGNRCL